MSTNFLIIKLTLSMRFLSIFTIAAMVATAFGSLFAQQPPANTGKDYAAEVRTTLYDFVKAYQEIPKTKDVFSPLQFFDKSYETDRIRINIEERVEIKADKYSDLENLFNMLATTPGLELEYRINEILEVYGTENIGYCSFKASYEAKRFGQVYIIGDETATYFFKRIDGRYKIFRAHFIQVRDRINRAECPCQLYRSQADESAFLAQIEFPTGTAFANKIHTFAFKYISGLHVIVVDGFYYHWEGDEKIVVMDNEVLGKRHPDAGQVIGKAKTNVQAIGIILRDHLYRKNCSAIKFED